MPINTVPIVSTVRNPRSIVQANGVKVGGLKSWDVDEIEFSHPSTFRCLFALNAPDNEADPAWWFSQEPDIEVEIFVGEPTDPSNYGTGDLESLFVGRADEVTAHWDTGLLEVTGRDLAAKLMDLKSSKKYVNQTASQVATQLASDAGLTPVVTSTSTKVSKYYEIDHIQLQDDRTEWDLLTWLAREEGFAAYVKGRELHFEPKPDAGADPYLLRFTPGGDQGYNEGNFTSLSTTRVLTMAKDIKVIVRSWNAKRKKAFTKTATRSKKGGGEVQEFSYVIAGLDPEQAQARADKILAEQSKHEMRLSHEGPADNLLHIANVIQVTGTGTAADQVYFPASIARSFDAESGYRWSVEAKNHATESESSL